MTLESALNSPFLEHLRRHDPDALAEAIREHARPLLRGARAMGFEHREAEDLVQDVFSTFLERRDIVEGRSSPIPDFFAF